MEHEFSLRLQDCFQMNCPKFRSAVKRNCSVARRSGFRNAKPILLKLVRLDPRPTEAWIGQNRPTDFALRKVGSGIVSRKTSMNELRHVGWYLRYRKRCQSRPRLWRHCRRPRHRRWLSSVELSNHLEGSPIHRQRRNLNRRKVKCET